MGLPSSNKSCHSERGARGIYAVIICGLLIRVVGVGFGLPGLYHADEPIIVNHAVAYGGWDFNPHFFKLPPLLSYLLFVVYGIYFVLGYVFGLFSSISDFEVLFLTDPTTFYFIGRVLFGVLAGTATIYLVYRFADAIWGDKQVSLLSALFLALSYLHVRNSHYLYADIPMVFMIMVAALAMVRLYRRGDLKDYIWVGLVSGIAAGFKYNAALLAVSITIIHFMRHIPFSIKKPLFDKKIYLCALFMVGTFILTNPYMILAFAEFSADLLTQAQAEVRLPFFYHLRHSLAEGLGLPLLCVSLFGLLMVISKEIKKGVAFFSFPIIFYIFCVYVSQRHARYMMPIVPFMAVLGAYGVREISQLRSLKENASRFLVIALLVLLPMTIKSIYLDRLFVKKDTRALAKAWIEKNIPSGSAIAYDHTFYLPKMRFSEGQMKAKYSDASSAIQKKRLSIMMANRGEPSYENYYLNPSLNASGTEPQFLFAKPAIQGEWKEIHAHNIKYLVLYGREEAFQSFYDEMRLRATLVKVITPYHSDKKRLITDTDIHTAAPIYSDELYARRRLGHEIRIYKVL